MTPRLDEWRSGLAAAWHDLCFFPLPSFLRGKNSTAENDFFRLLCYPLLGALAGTLLLCTGWGCRLFLSRTAASVCFGVCSLVILEGKDRGQGLTAQSRVLASFFAGDDAANDLFRQMLVPAFFSLLLLAKLASCISLFFHGSGGMAGAALIVNFSVRSELLGFGDVNPHGLPAMKCTMQQRRVLRGAALLLLFLTTLSHPLLFLLLGMGSALLILSAERIAIQRGELGAKAVSSAGAAAETAALLLSALVIS